MEVPEGLLPMFLEPETAVGRKGLCESLSFAPQMCPANSKLAGCVAWLHSVWKEREREREGVRRDQLTVKEKETHSNAGKWHAQVMFCLFFCHCLKSSPFEPA